MRLSVYATGVAAVLAGGLWWSISMLQDARAELRAERVRSEQLDGQLKALNERIGRAAEARRAGDTLRAEVRNEVSKSSWGAESIPSNVVERLCKSASCTARPAVPASDN